jgi:acyl-CoA thioester hydrolase
MKTEKARTITRRLEITPRFHQTDMMGVVHNAEYFLWFEEGRLQVMSDVIPVTEALELGVITPVVENHCVYKTPARFGNQLTLVTTHNVLPAYEGRLRFDHHLVDKATKSEIASGYTVITLVDAKNMRLIKEWIPELWSRYQALA